MIEQVPLTKNVCIKKQITVILLLFILLFSFAFTACSKNDSEQNISLNVDKSWFNTFSISGDAVTISCVVYLENSSDDIVYIELHGYFPEDYASNLLAQEELIASLPGEQSNTIIPVEPGGKAYSVEFVGKFAGNYMKHDRRLPKIEIVTKD